MLRKFVPAVSTRPLDAEAARGSSWDVVIARYMVAS